MYALPGWRALGSWPRGERAPQRTAFALHNCGPCVKFTLSRSVDSFRFHAATHSALWMHRAAKGRHSQQSVPFCSTHPIEQQRSYNHQKISLCISLASDSCCRPLLFAMASHRTASTGSEKASTSGSDMNFSPRSAVRALMAGVGLCLHGATPAFASIVPFHDASSPAASMLRGGLEPAVNVVVPGRYAQLGASALSGSMVSFWLDLQDGKLVGILASRVNGSYCTVELTCVEAVAHRAVSIHPDMQASTR